MATKTTFPELCLVRYVETEQRKNLECKTQYCYENEHLISSHRLPNQPPGSVFQKEQAPTNIDSEEDTETRWTHKIIIALHSIEELIVPEN